MDEVSWQSKLLKSNINITNIDYENKWIYLDFSYRVKSGGPQRWGKTMVRYYDFEDIDAMVSRLKEAVLHMRKELEG